MDTILMKYRSLEHDYLVFDTNKNHGALSAHAVRTICSQNCGLKSSALVVGPFVSRDGKIDVKVFSPDGEEQPSDREAKNAGLTYLRDAGYLTGKPDGICDARAVGKVFLSGALMHSCFANA